MPDRTIYTAPLAFPGSGLARQMNAFGGVFPLLTTDLALNRTVGLFVVPKGFILQSWSGSVPDLDTNGTPTLAFSLGDSGSAGRFIAASTKGQAGHHIADADLLSAARGYEFTADTEILWTTTTAAATAAAGSLILYMHGWNKFQ